MAVLDNKTQGYYKIDFENCSVRGRKVFVNFAEYETAAERDKEKERAEKWAKFQRELRKKIDGDYKTLLAAASDVAANTVTERQSKVVAVKEVSAYLKALPAEEQALAAALNMSEDGMIDKTAFPELRAVQEEMHELEEYERLIPNALYSYNGQHSAVTVPKKVEAQLKGLGFDTAWVSDPVRITGSAEVYAGEYNDEHIDHEFFYARLKTAMPKDVSDC